MIVYMLRKKSGGWYRRRSHWADQKCAAVWSSTNGAFAAKGVMKNQGFNDEDMEVVKFRLEEIR